MSEDRIPYTATPSYLEAVQSQLPALQLLINMGWDYLSPEECVALRGGRLSTALLEPVLLDHIRENCRFDFKGQTHAFTENAIQSAVQALKNVRATGATFQNEEVYDLLCLGTSQPQTVEGDTKSFDLKFIDWENWENNTYHCTAEFKTERMGQSKHYIPDIVLFVNGIPVVVIECKRAAYTDPNKKPIDLAIAQLGDYQQGDGIPQVFLTTQLLLALARDKAEFGTTGTPRKFWSRWREEYIDEQIRDLIGITVPNDQLAKLLDGPFATSKQPFKKLLNEGRSIYEQDRTLYGTCRPERLLELMFQFIQYDNGQKKIARYQQYFAVKDILKRVTAAPEGEQRAGGVVWHTQGSGKSLTMVMLAKALAISKRIENPRIILVTDRIDLDDQIYGTFKACGMKVEQASTGAHLIEMLQDGKRHIITTLIHKFAAATARSAIEVDHNTFVLVDESHRSNYSEHHARMKLALKGACFIGFTGTPLAKDPKKNTFFKFGELFKPAYTIARAVEDKAVLPLIYEARHVPQPVQKEAIDRWFERLTSSLTEAERADLKRKYSSETQLNKAAQKIRMVAWDVSLHYSMAYQGTGMKGQLVAPDKEAARLYKKTLDEFSMVTSEVLVSGPGTHEGESRNPEATAEEKVFWQGMMDRYGSEEKYNKQLINAFKKAEEPEIIIVVDKLLTGFDAPCNTVLYLARTLKDHSLLQAIARVNRLYEGKEFGLIMDYSGVIENLDEAIDFYTNLADYNHEDLVETVTYITDEAAKLPQLHSDLWELFAAVKGSSDTEVYQEHLRDEERRAKFYERFSAFARAMALALASTTFLEQTPEKQINIYKNDLKFFRNLRTETAIRFQERIDFSEYEPKIRKLLDTHVGASEVEQLIEPIDLLNTEQREEVLGREDLSEESKADMIASAARHSIEQEFEKDPAFFTKFSKLLEDTIEALHQKRIQAAEALAKIKDIAIKVATHTDEDVPKTLVGHDMARRYYGTVQEELAEYTTAKPDVGATIALEVVKRLNPHKVRDWTNNTDALNAMRREIDDIFFEAADEFGLEFPLELQDKLIDKCLEIAIANEK
ncbi:MAG: HsdR family type I site-specific deoxyribonuclease [Kiritimatiellae bacterium]|nr:HsdR family type I site-specific deoxyribonuclease [Kiritimatiellia bacterium]